MRILKCSNCNRLIHAGGACFFCRSSKESPQVCAAEVHENARTSLSMAETLVAQGRFDEALAALAEVMKWSPNSSEVHWLRLLARARCKSDAELFYSGADIADSADFDTALRYASEEEKQVYCGISNSCNALRKTLVDMIKSRNAMTIDKLNLSEVLSQMQQYVGEKRGILLSTWQELRKCEQELKLIENEGEFYMHECRTNMQNILSSSLQLRESLEDTSEIARKQFFEYKTKLEGLKRAAENAKDEYYRLKSSHPSVAAFAELCKKRDELKSAVDRELSEIREYEKKIEAVISRLNSEKEAGTRLLEYAESGNYEQVKSALGQNNFERAAQYALSLK